MINETAIALLKASLSDDGTIIRQLIDLYTRDSPQQLREAAAALEQHDMTALSRVAHSLKSTSATMGATAVSDLAWELEQSARQGDRTQSATTLEKLKTGLDEAIAGLARIRP